MQGSKEAESGEFSVALPRDWNRVRDQDVGSSNPLAPTNLFSTTCLLSPYEKVVVSWKLQPNHQLSQWTDNIGTAQPGADARYEQLVTSQRRADQDPC